MATDPADCLLLTDNSNCSWGELFMVFTLNRSLRLTVSTGSKFSNVFLKHVILIYSLIKYANAILRFQFGS